MVLFPSLIFFFKSLKCLYLYLFTFLYFEYGIIIYTPDKYTEIHNIDGVPIS